jgi:gamma-glutamylcyclotransferase (GGCT)/AIG2-like uncharacterized protein YtfP
VAGDAHAGHRIGAQHPRAGPGRGAVKIDIVDLLALCGTLMSPFAALDELDARRHLRLIGPCEIPGRLFDVGEWPSLLAGEGVAHGELFEVLAASVFERLDPFEAYDAGDHAASAYIRMRVRLLRPDAEAWVYVANTLLTGAVHIPSGSWHEWIATRAPRPDARRDAARRAPVENPGRPS